MQAFLRNCFPFGGTYYHRHDKVPFFLFLSLYRIQKLSSFFFFFLAELSCLSQMFFPSFSAIKMNASDVSNGSIWKVKRNTVLCPVNSQPYEQSASASLSALLKKMRGKGELTLLGVPTLYFIIRICITAGHGSYK